MNNAAIMAHDWFPRPLPANVHVSEGSWCYSAFAFLHCRSRRPRAVHVGRLSGIYDRTFFDLGPQGEVIIGDYCTLVGAMVSVNCKVVIRDYTLIAHEVVIADRSFATPPLEGASDETLEARGGDRADAAIVLGENVWVGARAIILGPVQVGEGAIIGAGAVVGEDVPAFAIVAGNPACVVGSTTARQRA